MTDGAKLYHGSYDCQFTVHSSVVARLSAVARSAKVESIRDGFSRACSVCQLSTVHCQLTHNSMAETVHSHHGQQFTADRTVHDERFTVVHTSACQLLTVNCRLTRPAMGVHISGRPSLSTVHCRLSTDDNDNLHGRDGSQFNLSTGNCRLSSGALPRRATLSGSPQSWTAFSTVGCQLATVNCRLTRPTMSVNGELSTVDFQRLSTVNC